MVLLTAGFALQVLNFDKPPHEQCCTFVATGKNFVEQHWYFCHTCGLVYSEGMCTVCARVCHKGLCPPSFSLFISLASRLSTAHTGHDISYSRRSRFFCDCGVGAKGVCSSLRPRPPGSEDEESATAGEAEDELIAAVPAAINVPQAQRPAVRAELSDERLAGVVKHAVQAAGGCRSELKLSAVCLFVVPSRLFLCGV